MKTSLQVLLGLSLAVSARAEFRTWIRTDGKMAELELIRVTGAGTEMAGDFKTRKGETINLKASVLTEGDARLLDAWKAPEPAAAKVEEKKGGSLDRFFDGKLLKFEEGKLTSSKEVLRPAKCYILACMLLDGNRVNLPALQKFRENSPYKANFEIIVASLDKDDSDMERVAKSREISSPLLKLRWVDDLFDKFMPDEKAGSRTGIYVLDTEGKILEMHPTSNSDLQKLIK